MLLPPKESRKRRGGSKIVEKQRGGMEAAKGSRKRRGGSKRVEGRDGV